MTIYIGGPSALIYWSRIATQHYATYAWEHPKPTVASVEHGFEPMSFVQYASIHSLDDGKSTLPSSTYFDAFDAGIDLRPIHLYVGQKCHHENSENIICHQCNNIQYINNSFLRINDEVYVASPELAYIQTCALDGEIEDHILLGMELTGAYASTFDNENGHLVTMVKRNPLTTHARLERYCKSASKLWGRKAALAALPYIVDRSASPRETVLAMVLGMPLCRYGEGFGMPEMNHYIKTVHARPFSTRGHYWCDLYWPGLDVEYDGGEHVDEIRQNSDRRRTNELMEHDIHVVRVARQELESQEDFRTVTEVIRRRLNIRKRSRSEDNIRHSDNLRSYLLKSIQDHNHILV